MATLERRYDDAQAAYDRNGQSISVIGLDGIRQVQGPDLARVLERLPSVSLARSGPLGSQTSLFVRGANSQQLVVTLDGVRLADVAAPSGGFDFGTLMAWADKHRRMKVRTNAETVATASELAALR